MTPVLYVTAGILAAVVAFVFWRIGSVGRGARQRDARILRELAVDAALRSGSELRPTDVAAPAGKPHLRRLLFGMLRDRQKADLFPQEHLSRRSQAEAALVYWMMHPNELQEPPAEIQHVVSLSREVLDRKAEFEVFRYRMPAGHWAGSEWILGLAGPFFAGDSAYGGPATGWSVASETEGRATPEGVLEGYLARIEVPSGDA